MVSLFFNLLKKIFWKENTFLPVQLLFTWVIYRILGFLKITFFYRLCIAIIFFFLLYYCWYLVIFSILNNVFFQFYVYISLRMVNFLIRFEKVPFYLALWNSFILGILFNPCVKINSSDFMILIPHIDLILFTIFIVSFIHKLVNNVIYMGIYSDFIVLLDKATSFNWEHIIQIFNSFFPPRYEELTQVCVKNCLSKLVPVNSSFSFLFYPFSLKFLNVLILPENNLSLYLKNGYDTKQIKDREVEFLKELNMFLDKRRMNLCKYLSELFLLNNIFYFKIFYGSISGYLLAFLYLNL